MTYIYNILAMLCYAAVLAWLPISKQRFRVLFFVAATLHVALFHALRDPFAFPDNDNYAMVYAAAEGGWNELLYKWGQFETGYLALNFLMHGISANAEFFFICVSLFMVGGFMMVAYKWSFVPVLSVLLYMIYPYMFYQSLFVLRQNIACILILMALYCLQQPKKSVLFAILAISMHTSAVAFLPFYLFHWLYRRIGLRRVMLYGLGAVLAMRLSVGFVYRLVDRYTHYSDISENNIVPLILLGSLFVMHILNGTYRRADNACDHTVLSYLAYGALMSLFVIGIPGGARLSTYFIYNIPFALPLLLKYRTTLHWYGMKVLYVMTFIGAVLYMDYVVYMRNGIVEYKMMPV